MRLGAVKDWKRSQNKFLKKAADYQKTAAEKEKAQTVSGLDREAFKGNSVDINKLAPGFAKQFQKAAGKMYMAGRAAVARGLGRSFGKNLGKSQKSEASGFHSRP